MNPPYRVEPGGLRLAVKVTPGAKSDALAGIVDIGEGRTALAVRLAARPVAGAANKALISLLAAALDVPRSRVAIVAGDSARLKLVRVAGVSAEAAERLAAS